MTEVHEGLNWLIQWTIYKAEDQEHADREEYYEVSQFSKNLLLNEGIALLEDLLIGAGGTAYNNANARIGVGDSATAEGATQTSLQAASNKLWRGMQATYPQRSSQTVTWRAQFASGDANYAWNEFTVVNAADDTGTNLNRKVSTQGTKTAGQVWTVDVQLTIS